jgi:N-acetylglucosaminyldiphosphoundecaprenol N-acetyl-beta-D-mannosaminyltransferase
MASRVSLLGLEIDAVTEAQAVGTVMRGLAEGRGGAVATPNLHHLRQRTHSPELASIFESADLVVADGQPLVWASRLQGTPLPERVAGSELVWSLAAEAALRGRSVFLLGGAPGACDAAAERLRECYPGLAVAGTNCPPLGFEDDPKELAEIGGRLRDAQPDIVYVALGFPKQERLIARLRSEFPRIWFLGVGYSLTFIADERARAPDWVIRLGLEWAHRLVKEPRRLAKRYVVEGIPFAVRLLARALCSRARRRELARPAPKRVATIPERVVFVNGAVERERARLLAELLAAE